MDNKKGSVSDLLIGWSIESMLEISIPEPDNFLKIKETLTRIGVASKKNDTLYQSCNILHKKGKYYIVHFKEIFNLDGRASTLTSDDISRRNTIANLLQEWKLLTILQPDNHIERVSLNNIKIIAYKDKFKWSLVAKYQLGLKKTWDNCETYKIDT